MESHSNTSAQIRILVAEDNAVNQKVILFVLAKAGHFLEFANDGIEVMQKIKENSYDLILMDCQMPNLDGLKATQRIRANEALNQDQRIPIVALTANAMVGDRERCLAVGMDDFLAKPFKPDEIKQKITLWAQAKRK